MSLMRSLPPQFLLPAWNPRQIARLSRSQARLNHDSAGPPIGRPSRVRRGSRSILARDEARWVEHEQEHALPEHSTRKTNALPSDELSGSPTYSTGKLPSEPSVTDAVRGIKEHWKYKKEQYKSKEASRYLGRRLPLVKSISEPKPAVSAKVRDDADRSLYELMFPEEVEAQEREAEKRLERLPAFNWNADKVTREAREVVPSRNEREHREWKPQENTKSMHSEQDKHMQQDLHRRTSVLVLSAASKTLEESDFFRLSPKGEHIEGWTSGITKVIPARDARTLEALGFYYILFSSEYAARAYLDNMVRLHRMARVVTHLRNPFLPPKHQYLLRPGEDLKELLQGFTLIGTQGRLGLRLLDKPHTPHTQNIIKYGGIKKISNGRNNAENMVLLWTEAGQWSVYDIMEALKIDGLKRNLFWKLAGSGKDIQKLSQDQVAQDEETSGEEEWHSRIYRAPSRYSIAFKDSHEARRFVREWNRRPFPKQIGQEDPPMMNVGILW